MGFNSGSQTDRMIVKSRCSWVLCLKGGSKVQKNIVVNGVFFFEFNLTLNSKKNGVVNPWLNHLNLGGRKLALMLPAGKAIDV